MTANTSTADRIGYVLKVFPRVSETFVINEIRALEDLGQRVSIFSLHHGDRVPHGLLRQIRSPIFHVEDEPVEEKEIGAWRRHLARALVIEATEAGRFLPRKYVRLALALARLARDQEVMHLHAHFASRAGHVAALAAAIGGWSFSMTAHAKDIYHESVDRDLLRWKLNRAKFVVTVTHYNQSYLCSLLGNAAANAGKVSVLYNGIDLDRFCPLESPPSSVPLVLGVGRLVEKKGFADLIEACRRLRDRGRMFGCEIVGGGPEEASLRERITTAGLQNHVRLRGVMATEDVARLLPQARVVVLPSIVARDGNVDALPTVLLEAMAAARPVISTRLSGIPEIVVDGETGFLVLPGDPEALAHATDALLADPSRADRMGRAGRERAEQLFDLRANVARLHCMLRRGPEGLGA